MLTTKGSDAGSPEVAARRKKWGQAPLSKTTMEPDPWLSSVAQAGRHQAHQHLRPGLRGRGVAGVPGARRSPGDRRRHRSGEARPDPQPQVAHPRGGHPGADARRGRLRPRDGDQRRAAGDARHRDVVHLRGHAVGGERQPGPHRHPAARRAARRGAQAQAGVPHHRDSLDGAAGNGGREDRADSRARQRQEVRRRLRLVLPARVPARRLIDPRLRPSAVHHRRRQLRSGGRTRCASCSSISMRASWSPTSAWPRRSR